MHPYPARAVAAGAAALLMATGACVAEPAGPSLSSGASVASNDRDDANLRYEAFEREVRASSDLRLRIVFSRGIHEADRRAEDFTPLTALLDAARGTTDPVVLQLLLGRCPIAGRAADGCDAVDLARRWTVADAQNQLAWAALASTLDSAGDAASASEAWARAAQASTARDEMFALVRTIYRALPPDRSRPVDDLVYAIGVAAAAQSKTYALAYAACRDGTRQSLCATLASTMYRDADTVMGMMFAIGLARKAHVPDAEVARREQTFNALQWASIRTMDRMESLDRHDSEALATARRLVEQIIVRGPIEAARDDLLAAHIGEAEAATRFKTSQIWNQPTR